MAIFHAIWIIALALLVKLVVLDNRPAELMPAKAEPAPATAPEITQPIIPPKGEGGGVAIVGVSPQPTSLLAGSPVRFEQLCEKNLPTTKVEVELAPHEVVYDFAQSVAALTEHARKGQDGVILGLTKSGLGTQFKWHMNLLTDTTTGQSCMRPQIRMLVATGAQEVYVAREFERAGCAFNEVLDHELHHVHANRDQLALSALELRSKLRQTLANRVFYGTRKELERQLTEAVNDYWLPMAKLKFSEKSPVHAEIDSEDGYRDVLSRCEGEFAQVLRSLRR